jgi:glutamate/tyrosine decarboxylase-like PLP-dependent enzyme
MRLPALVAENPMSHDDRNALLARAAQHGQAYLGTVADRPVAASATSEELRSALGSVLGAEGTEGAAVIDALAAAAERGTLATQGPRYFGFVIGGSLPVATAADWLVSAWDQNSAVYAMAPMVSVVEEITAGWMRDLLRLPDHRGVGFVTGCQMASFTALAAARHDVLRRAGWDVEAAGLTGAPAIDVLVSEESHYTISMALRLLGLGAGRARRVPTDAQGRMVAPELARMLLESTGPCIVCAQAGNVNTGAFDPIEEIARLCRARGAWLHVDGAFGLWARTSPSLGRLAAGLEGADSIATDGHKWLNVPYDCGIVFCAHPEAHRAAMSMAAAYIVSDTQERDPHEFVPEESRRARAVPVYAVLRSLGRDGLRALVERNCSQARRMAERLGAEPEVRILNDVVLNQVLVRFEDPHWDADALTRAVIAGVQQEGTCWLGGTVWHGMAAMRISISNWSTTEQDVERSADAILEILRARRQGRTS